ncbi:MAG: hypothetical protein KJO11_12780, partial [Gemmatimonadetes bacterium]|nr:hypothetical protein [Gemmatimonadota bacterium]
SKWRRFLMPGIAFQAVVIGGGYGTGREIVEFFLTQGVALGLAAMALTTAIFSLVCAVSYEFARRHSTFEYRSFFRELVGPGAVLFEVAWVVFMLIVLSVVTAAVGSIVRDTFGLPYWSGVAGLALVTVGLVYRGTDALKAAFEAWTVLLFVVFAVTLVAAFATLGPGIESAFLGESAGAPPPVRTWFLAGIAYAGYNLSLIPALLYTVESEVTSRRDAFVAGALAGPIAMAPALMFFIALSALYPGVLDTEVPSNALLEAIGSRSLQVTFQIVLIGTLVATAAGMVQSVNARLGFATAGIETSGSAADGARRGSSASALAGALWMAVAAFFAQFGLIDLIARGYGTATWVFIAVYVVPVLTVGVVRIWRRD